MAYRFVLAAACVVGVAMSTGLAAGEQVTLTPDRDNTLFGYADGSASNGAGDSIFVGTSGPFGGGLLHRGLVRFDVAAGVPAGALVRSVSLTMFLIQGSGLGDPADFTLHRALADWGEGTSQSPGGLGAPATPGDATWLHTFFPDQFWTNEGGDFEPAPSATITIPPSPNNTFYTWRSTAQLVADVQSWLDQPATNFGWVMVGNETLGFTARRLASRENLVPTHVPMLTIEYELCPWDCGDDDDGQAGIVDLLALLAQWGQEGAPCDFDGGGVGDSDLQQLLDAWATCPARPLSAGAGREAPRPGATRRRNR
jgi:hypothetical protein